MMSIIYLGSEIAVVVTVRTVSRPVLRTHFWVERHPWINHPTPAPSTLPPTSLQRTLFTIHDNSYTAMATTIPDSLKSADIGRFVTRAAQIERAKPVIAYWCWYWVVNQIISKGLHSTDAESTQYTTDLMDKLERVRAAYQHEHTTS